MMLDNVDLSTFSAAEPQFCGVTAQLELVGNVAVMVVVPELKLKAVPNALMVATPVLLDAQATSSVMSCVLESLNKAVAV